MLPNPFDDLPLDPKVKAILELGQVQGRLQVYQEISQSLVTVFKANEEGADFNVADELLLVLEEGITDTITAQCDHIKKFSEIIKNGQNDS